jgi:hypothetical protein
MSPASQTGRVCGARCLVAKKRQFLGRWTPRALRGHRRGLGLGHVRSSWQRKHIRASLYESLRAFLACFAAVALADRPRTSSGVLSKGPEGFSVRLLTIRLRCDRPPNLGNEFPDAHFEPRRVGWELQRTLASEASFFCYTNRRSPCRRSSPQDSFALQMVRHRVGWVNCGCLERHHAVPLPGVS